MRLAERCYERGGVQMRHPWLKEEQADMTVDAAWAVDAVARAARMLAALHVRRAAGECGHERESLGECPWWPRGVWLREREPAKERSERVQGIGVLITPVACSFSLWCRGLPSLCV